MRPISTSTCLTRIVDTHRELEVAELRQVVTRIQDAVRQVIPPPHQTHVCNALLQLALEYMVQTCGTQTTATTLIRLIDSVLAQDASPPGLPFDLTSPADNPA